MSRILVIGSSGHAKVVINATELQNQHQIVGLIDRFCEVGSETLGYPVMGGEHDVPALAKQYDLTGYVIAIGDNAARQRVASRIAGLAPFLELVSIVHPSASVGIGVDIGEGTVVLAGAIINADCKVGRGCIVNSGAILEHDSVMGDFSTLAPGAVTGGKVIIGDLSSVNIGAVVSDRIRIGNNAVVGAGAVVLANIENDMLVYGVPARPIRTRAVGERSF